MRPFRACNIEQWADRLDARADMPTLLRRLVHATLRDSSRVDFPAWEGIERPGWDGVVVSPTGNSFVPEGISYWEIGASRNVKGKADGDFKKRTEDPIVAMPSNSTYVFVSPRKWTRKIAWCNEKKGLGQWKDIRVYDSGDLEQWLETAPAVAIWFGRVLGIRPLGVSDLERYWDSVSSLTNPALLPEVFVASRSEEESKVLEWMAEPPTVLAIECRSLSEVIDFVLAVLTRLDPKLRDCYLSRSVIVESRDAFDVLRDSACPLILLVRPSLALEADLVSSATRNGHHVLVAVTRITQTNVKAMPLPRAYRYELAKALELCGYSEVESERASRAAGGSLTILKRRLATVPTTNSPSWANATSASRISPFLWIGGWTSNCEADCQAVSRLTGCCQKDLESAANMLAECEEPLLIRGPDRYSLLSKEDAWMLLGRHVSESEFNQFESLSAEIVIDHGRRPWLWPAPLNGAFG